MSDSFYTDPSTLPPPTARITVSPNQPVEADDWESIEQPQLPPPTTPQVAPGAPQQAQPEPSQPSAAEATVEDPGDWVSSPITSRDVDQKSGTPFAIRLEMARAANPNEAKLVLDKFYGEGNYGQDQRGNWWAMQDGKPTAIFPSGLLGPDNLAHAATDTIKYGPGVGPLIGAASRSPAMQNMAAHVGATATPMAGAVAGGTLGTALAGPFGAVVGTGVGAAGGYGIDQLVKWYRGLYSQKPMEVARNMAGEASMNSAMAGILPLAKSIGRGLGSAYRSWSGVTPESQRMTGQLTAEGAHPPMASAAPDARSIIKKQTLRNLLSGDPWEATNTQYVQGRFKDALKSSGVPDNEIDDIIAAAANPTAAPSRTEAGEALVQSVQRYVGDINAEIHASRQASQIELRRMEGVVRNWSTGAGRQMDALGEDVAQTFIQSRQAFGRAAGREYRAVDALTGDQPVFDLEPAWRQARTIIDRADPGSVPPYLRQMMERYNAVEDARRAVQRIPGQIDQLRNAPVPPGADPAAWAQNTQAQIQRLERDFIRAEEGARGNMTTFSEGHEMRSNLREMVGHEVDLTRSPWMHKLSEVEDQINNTFRRMERDPGIPGQAASRLRQADENYRDGIRVFKDAQIGQIIRDVRSGVSPDPESVASTILREGRTQSARRMINMLPEELRENVARADMRNIIEESSKRGPDGGRYLDGLALMDALDARKRATLMVELHGQPAVDALRTYARQLAALDGKVAVDGLPPDRLSQTIANTINRQRQLEQFVTGNAIGKLRNGTAEEVDSAARALSRPGNEAHTLEAVRFFGPDSQEWGQVQKHALTGLVRESMIQTPAGRNTISGEALEKAIKQYTPRQQEALFPNGLADDLREVARQSKFLFPPGTGGSNDSAGQAMSLAANNISLNMGLGPRGWYYNYRYAHAALMGYLIDRPALLRFIAQTARENPAEGRALLGFATRTAINAQTMGPGKGRPTEGTEGGSNSQ